MHGRQTSSKPGTVKSWPTPVGGGTEWKVDREFKGGLQIFGAGWHEDLQLVALKVRSLGPTAKTTTTTSS